MSENRDGILRPNKLLLATDGSADADLAARVAIGLVAKTGAELHVAHAWTHHAQGFGYASVTWTDYSYLYERRARRLLAQQVDAIEAQDVEVAEPHLLQGPPVDAILDLCEDLHPGLLVIGSRGLGPVRRLLVGSVSEGIVHHARVPVLVVRGGETAWPPSRVVVGEDGSEGAARAAEVALSMGRAFGARDLLVRAHRNPPEPMGGWSADDRRRLDEARAEVQRDLEERAASLGSTTGQRPETRLVEGDATLALLMCAEEAEEGEEAGTLIAVGSRGLGVIGRMRLGSVSTNVLRGSVGPVLICPLPRERVEGPGRSEERDASLVESKP